MSEGLFFPQQTTSGITLPILDTQFILLDNSDQTKRAMFECSSISPATTRTFTFPDSNQIIVGTSAIQTFLGKTMSGASNTITNLPNSSLPTGTIIQVVNTQSGAVATGTTTIPGDDTIPQITEGDEYLTVAITPVSSSNKLEVTVVALLTNSFASGTQVMALFQDSTANALAATGTHIDTGGRLRILTIVYEMTAGIASSTTFRMRSGGASAGTTTFNGTGGSRLFGGVASSSITVKEIKA